jgi:hypothetical protein
MKYLLDVVQPGNHFSDKLKDLLEKYSKNIDPNALGLKSHWQNEPLWR